MKWSIVIRLPGSAGGKVILAAIALLAMSVGAADAETVDPDDLGLHWAWSASVGWIDVRPGGAGGPGLHADNDVVVGWMWSPNVGWISAHCTNTASCGEAKYGLRLESDPQFPGLLRLSGVAWSPNVGWIATDCRASGSCASVDYALRVDIETGVVDGWAWSANLGWINFSCANGGSCASVDFGVQFDSGALPDIMFADSFE